MPNLLMLQPARTERQGWQWLWDSLGVLREFALRSSRLRAFTAKFAKKDREKRQKAHSKTTNDKVLMRSSMHEFAGMRIPGSLEETISPQDTALIVYDMQVGIVPQIKNGAEITNRVSRLVS